MFRIGFWKDCLYTLEEAQEEKPKAEKDTGDKFEILKFQDFLDLIISE